jgi:small GTP-binding protein
VPVDEVRSGLEVGVIQRKVCLIGATAVGKTSLVRRFVESTFSESYLATVGVKVDRKRLDIRGQRVSLMLWDLQGEGEGDGQQVRMAYLRGSAGYLLVIDGTRPSTFTVAQRLQERAAAVARAYVPFVVLVNKSDRFEEWAASDAEIARLRDARWPLFFTSAKTGQGVEAAFRAIAERTLSI